MLLHEADTLPTADMFKVGREATNNRVSSIDSIK